MDRFPFSSLCATLLEKDTRAQRHTDQSWPHIYHTILDKWTSLTCLRHNMLIVCLFQSHNLHPHSICAHTHTHNTHLLFSPCLETCKPASTEKLGKRSSARVHHASNILLAARAFGEQSRYYFERVPAHSGTHYLIYNHANDSVHANYWSSVVPVSIDSVYQ